MSNPSEQTISPSRFLRRILRERGIPEIEELRFLRASLSDLSDPFEIPAMEEACYLLRNASSRNIPICIYADGDVDGISSAAMLARSLQRAGSLFDVRFTSRLESYEIDSSYIKNLKQKGFGLLVLLDTGTSSCEALETCQDISLPVILVDHHVPSKPLPEKVVSLNPHAGHAPSRMKQLSSAGLSFLFVRALEGLLPAPAEKEDRAFLELAAMGTLNDYSSLTGDNRIIVKHGLRSLRFPSLPGLRLFRKSFYVPSHVDAVEPVTFFLNPKLNTPGRFGNPETSFSLLMLDDGEDGSEYIKTIERLEKEKSRLLKKATAAAERIDYRGKPPLAYVEGIPVSFSGTIAARLSDRAKLPAAAIIPDGDSFQGSARGHGLVDLFAHFSSNRDIFLSFGGHRNAVGFKLKQEKKVELEELWDSLEGSFFSPLPEPDPWDLSLEDLDTDFLHEFEMLKPFGSGNPEMLFTAGPVSVNATDRTVSGCSVGWVRQNKKSSLFEALFPDRSRPVPSVISKLVYTPRTRSLGDGLFTVQLLVRDYSAGVE